MDRLKTMDKNQIHEEELVRYERIDGVAVLTLNNPKKRNALSIDLLKSLQWYLTGIQEDPTVHVVIIRAVGTVFSAGHDLRELLNQEEKEHIYIFALCTEIMQAIRLLRQPVIAEVDGLATAAGCQLVASCDLVVASSDATFATPGVTIGLFCTTPGVALVRSISHKKAMDMLLTGEPISASEALMHGLVSRVVDKKELEKQTMDIARQISSASTHAVSLGKEAFYRQLELEYGDAYSFAQRVMVDNLKSYDANEGIDAFLSKRTPKWRGV